MGNFCLFPKTRLCFHFLERHMAATAEPILLSQIFAVGRPSIKGTVPDSRPAFWVKEEALKHIQGIKC